MLEHARRWAPFGGGEDGDILISFGLEKSEFYKRISGLIRLNPSYFDQPTMAAITQTAEKFAGIPRSKEGIRVGKPRVRPRRGSNVTP